MPLAVIEHPCSCALCFPRTWCGLFFVIISRSRFSIVAVVTLGIEFVVVDEAIVFGCRTFVAFGLST